MQGKNKIKKKKIIRLGTSPGAWSLQLDAIQREVGRCPLLAKASLLRCGGLAGCSRHQRLPLSSSLSSVRFEISLFMKLKGIRSV